MNGFNISNIHKKSVGLNLLYAILASTLTNFVLQFFVYPVIEKTVGEEKYGKILFFISLGIISSLSIGGAVSTSYLKSRQSYSATNGDFFSVLLLFSTVACMVSAIVSFKYCEGIIELVLVVLFVLLYTLYYYSYVSFQLTNDYFHYFIYALIVSLGFIASSFIIKKTGRWGYLSFALIIGIIYVIFKGDLYTNPFKTSKNLSKVFKSSLVLSGSNILNYATQNLDRIILLPLVNGTAVTYYYVASLLSKTLSLVTGPVNNLILSYQTRKGEKLSLKKYFIFNIITIIIGFAFYFTCIIISPFLLKLPFLYPDLVETVRQYIPLVSLGQVLVISSSIIVALDIVVAPERIQLLIQGVYSISFLVMSIILTNKDGLNGFIVSSCFSGAIRYIVSLIIGIVYIKKGDNAFNESK